VIEGWKAVPCEVEDVRDRRSRDRALAICGIVGGLVWAVLPIFAPESGATRTAEETFNRPWAPLLVLMGLGFLGLRRRLSDRRLIRVSLTIALVGLALMVLGNVSEYWLFHDLPYGNPARDLSWMTVLLGWLIVMISGTVAGIGALVGRAMPSWVAWSLAALLPATIGLAAVAIGLLGLPLGLASAASGVWLVTGRSPVLAMNP
jgi:hypothetical protein